MSETTRSEWISDVGLWRLLRRIPANDWLIVGWVLALKILLFVFAKKSYQIFEDKRLESLYSWLELWNRWDAPHYLQVARAGYQAADILVYPLLPWLVRFFNCFVDDYFLSALAVVTFAAAAAATLLYRLVRLDFSDEVSLRAVRFFLIFPTAYFLHAGYTESLFLALVFGCLLAARTDRWWLAGLLGALCPMTRANGVALLPVLAMEVIHQRIVLGHWRRRWLWIALLPVGYGVYLLISWRFAGGPFAFLATRKALFYTQPAWPWEGVAGAFGNMHRDPSQGEIAGAQEVYFIALGLVATAVSWIKLRPSYATWMTLNWLGITSLTFVQSAPRYTLMMFPIFIFFAVASANRVWNAVITVWSLLFLALFTTLFVRGWWAF